MTKRSASKPATRKKKIGRTESEPSRSQLRRDLEKATTRRLILEAARTMFAREGYDSTTMRGIADRIGYTATAIYHHFTDKHALMLELCANDFREFGAALTSIGGITDPVERIRQMGRNYVRFAVEHPEQFRFMFLIDRPLPGPDDMIYRDPGQDAYEFLKRAVVEAMAADRFRPEYDDADLLAQMFWAGVHGVATIHVVTPEDKQKWLDLRGSQETAIALCEALMRGLLRAS
jgi:AcrR family transcriptional regulator